MATTNASDDAKKSSQYIPLFFLCCSMKLSFGKNKRGGLN
jgi:hypothetical protein